MTPRHAPVPTRNLDHANLSRHAQAGHILAAHIVGQPGGWAIQVNIANQEHVLTAQRSGDVRLFKKLETLVSYLQDLGIDSFEVDSSAYDPRQLTTYQRPDRTQALKRAHEAAAYEAWFRDQVEASLNDTSPVVEDEEVRKLFAARRAAFKTKTR
jgi:hypothetical protein